MPRKREAVRGLWEREPGSNIWWIRYRVDGVLKREKVGAWGAAKELLNKRKNEIREGIKMPENMRQASVRFKTLCDDILVYSKKHHRDFRSVEIRLKKVAAEFGERPADKIKPAEIDAWLSKVTKTPATSNRYRALFSLIFREALRNGKIASNPARLVRQRAENNGRIRFLTEAEEMSLRDAIRSRFPEHEAELTISLGTGMRLSEQYTLAWKNIDFERREINLDRTKNGSPRMIPMNDAVMGAMEDFARRSKSTNRDTLLFSRLRIQRTGSSRRWRMPRSSTIGGMTTDTPFALGLAMRGENLKVIQQLAGHKTIQMSARYAHLGEKSLHAAVSGL